MNFNQFYICEQCDSRFVELPNGECPVCVEVREITNSIDTMKTPEQYNNTRIRISKMEDSIPKFDLYNKINRKKKEQI